MSTASTSSGSNSGPNSARTRRGIFKAAAALALTTATAKSSSADTNAADCHHHIYNHRFPADPHASLHPPDATVADYRALKRSLGLTRSVVVQPSTYGTDNRCMLDAIQQLGPGNTRGIAVISPDASDDHLKRLKDGGVVGIRFNLIQSIATNINLLQPLAKRIATLGWHIEVNAHADQILIALPVWSNLPVPVVFDHLAHSAIPGDPEFAAVTKLLHAGKCWVKVSGVYMESNLGPPTYADRAEVAKGYIHEAPDRLVWGTDWPHPTVTNSNRKPDDANLFNLLRQWCPNDSLFNRILITNPQTLYQFPG